SAVSGSTNEDLAIDIAPIAAAEDAGDSITSYAVGATSAHGASLSVVAGKLHYNPNGAAFFETLANGASATDTFTYTVTDNHGVSASATATVTVSVTDSGPVAGSASGSTNEDASTIITVSGAH